MPKFLVRYQQTGDLHFVTFSCYRRQAYLDAADARNLFEEFLEAMRRRHAFFITGYVIMPEHVHLLLSEPREVVLAKAIPALKLSADVQRCERPFRQARYYDFNVYAERKRIEKLRYMHRNSVKRGLAMQPEEWAWSSFRHYATGETGAVEIESHWTASRRDRVTENSRVSSRHGAPTCNRAENV